MVTKPWGDRIYNEQVMSTSKLRKAEERVVWKGPDGEVVSCTEKIKVLGQNLEELRQIAQDALEDAVLMGCSEAQLREVLHQLVDELHNPYD